MMLYHKVFRWIDLAMMLLVTIFPTPEFLLFTGFFLFYSIWHLVEINREVAINY